MLSICKLHLQLPFDDCPTEAAACSRRRQCVTHCRRLLQRQWDSVCCVRVCAVTGSLLTIMIRGSYGSLTLTHALLLPGPKKLFLCPDGRVATGEGRLDQ